LDIFSGVKLKVTQSSLFLPKFYSSLLAEANENQRMEQMSKKKVKRKWYIIYATRPMLVKAKAVFC